METAEQLLFDKLLNTISEYKASDLHLVAGNFPILRINGKLIPLSDEQPLTSDFLVSIANSLVNEQQKQILEKNKEIIFAYEAQNKMRFKVSICYQQNTLSVTFKLIPQQIKDAADLGLPSEIEQILTLQKGLVIIAGSFGSGKSTTIAALIEQLNNNQAKHIMTIEDPIECVFTDNQSIIEQREVGKDTASFIEALKFVAEEDVDIVMLSKLESEEVIKKVFEIVDSGRLVIAAMDSENVIKTLENIVNNFAIREYTHIQKKIAGTLSAIIAQKLLPGVQGELVLATEIFFPNDPARSVIESGDFSKLVNMLHSPQDTPMAPFDRSLAELVNKGKLKIETALDNADDKDYFRTLTNQ